MGLAVASVPILQALTMPVSAWLSTPMRRRRVIPPLLLLPPLAFMVVAWALLADQVVLGAVSLILASAWAVTYRNAVNLRLQELVPDAV